MKKYSVSAILGFVVIVLIISWSISLYKITIPPGFFDQLFWKAIEIILVPIFVILAYDFITFKRFWDGLCDEIDANYKRIDEQQIRIRIERMKREFNKKLKDQKVWAGFYKRISIYKIALKIDEKPLRMYRYLSNTEIMTFIHRGYYHAIKPYEQQLTLFYFNCENLSVETQQLEADFNYLCYPLYISASEQQKWECLDRVILAITEKFNTYRDEITNNYNSIHPYFRKDTFHFLKIYFKGIFEFDE